MESIRQTTGGGVQYVKPQWFYPVRVNSEGDIDKVRNEFLEKNPHFGLDDRDISWIWDEFRYLLVFRSSVSGVVNEWENSLVD